MGHRLWRGGYTSNTSDGRDRGKPCPALGAVVFRPFCVQKAGVATSTPPPPPRRYMCIYVWRYRIEVCTPVQKMFATNHYMAALHQDTKMQGAPPGKPGTLVLASRGW